MPESNADNGVVGSGIPASQESILEEAQRLIHGPRNKNYGHPRENFADIAALFSGYLGQEVSDVDVANLMILVKIARVKGTGYHRDSFTDIAGYAGCVERIYEEEPEPEPEKVFEGYKPRQWDSLYVTPFNVEVEDRVGARYKYHHGAWYLGGFRLDQETVRTGFNVYAPFTEVVE
ncbi:hypotheical protein [Mycobacterium phage PP]|uniref:Hypotheical protein n=1 Tax=Mycobacterium phage PP TaxID=2077134 RepID=A0A2Z5XVH2_9CAUD|nr:phosphofructokinase [Mycobacterium phage PP]BBC53849.1 hypotheical protein [Mycobacterium phage PP]